MKIIGIDPGLRITGFGILNVLDGKLQYISSGIIRTEGLNLPERLGTIFTSISELLNEYKPDAAAIEKVFVNINPQSTLLLGQARGAALCALTTHHLAIAEYTALQLKQAITGYGRANKAQIQSMIMQLLNLPSKPSRDASDALGIAICHINNHHATNAIKSASSFKKNISSKNLKLKRGRISI